MTEFEEFDAGTVILLTVDCLRRDTARERMEFLSELRRRNLSVEDVHRVGSGTPPSMPGRHQSRLPVEAGGAARAHQLPAAVPTLAEVLADGGYCTAGWHSNVYTSRAYGYQRGFDVFADLKEHSPTERVAETEDAADGSGGSLLSRGQDLADRLGVEPLLKRAFFALRDRGLVDYRPHVRAGRINDAALGWLPERADDRSRFAWLHYMDLHSPYAPERTYRERLEGCPVADREIWRLADLLQNRPGEIDEPAARSLRGLYGANAAYVDDRIADLVSALRRRDLWDETLLVVTADHGEMFGDRTIPDEFAYGHPNFLYEELTRVPLILAGGSVPAGQVTTVASGTDVPATIAAAAGVDRPSAWRGTVVGSDAFREREAVVSVTGRGRRQDGSEGEIPPETLHVAVRTGNRGVLWWDERGPAPELYDRTDYRETTVDSGVESAVAELRPWIDTVVAEAETEAEAVDLDDRTRERLDELGYL
jgi:arylsulfatase A-like enzyme